MAYTDSSGEIFLGGDGGGSVLFLVWLGRAVMGPS